MKKLLILLMLGCGASSLMGQARDEQMKPDYIDIPNVIVPYDRFFTLSYDMNLPLSNTSYTNSTSFRGVQLGFREKINDKFYMGLDLSNATYHDYSPRQTYQTETGAYTTDFFKYVYNYGATLAGEYYFNSENRVMPFAGLGIGANYNSYRMYYNIYSATDSGWGFLVRPQVGVLIKMGQQNKWGIIAAAHFDYSTAKSSKFDYTDFTNVGLKIGVVLFD